VLYWFGIDGTGTHGSLFGPFVLSIAAGVVLFFIARANMLGQSICTKKNGTLATLWVVRIGLNEYNAEFGSFPLSLKALVQEKILEPRGLFDSWKRPLIYQALDSGLQAPFLLFSAGSDGIPLTRDDVTLVDAELRQ